MAEYKLKEFAEICGMKMPALSNEKKRGKFRVNDRRKVDTSDPVNAIFLEKRLALKAGSMPAGAPVPEFIGGGDPIEADSAPDKRPDGELFTLEREKKTVDLARSRQELELTEIKKQKLRGDLIPTAVVRMAFTQLFGGFTTSFRQAAENLITEMTQIAHLNRNQQAELRRKLTKILNEAIDKGIDDSKKNIDNVVMEFRRDA